MYTGTEYLNKWAIDGGIQFLTVGVRVCRESRGGGENDPQDYTLELETSV